LRTLACDRRGATAIEFAIVAAPFIALLIAALQTSLVFFAQQTLETVSEQASRQLLVGAAQKLDKEEFHQLACNDLPPFMNCADLMVDVQTVDSFADVDTTTPSIYNDDHTLKTWQFNPGGAGDIVVMRTMYLLPVIGGPLGFSLANTEGSRRLLVATAVFQTEPYKT
jgi:Flp pilus assembly protein TadG